MEIVYQESINDINDINDIADSYRIFDIILFLIDI